MYMASWLMFKSSVFYNSLVCQGNVRRIIRHWILLLKFPSVKALLLQGVSDDAKEWAEVARNRRGRGRRRHWELIRASERKKKGHTVLFIKHRKFDCWNGYWRYGEKGKQGSSTTTLPC